jgi:predicted RNA-binding Zn-ribbon protein involved in translation (DUF1610 family)
MDKVVYSFKAERKLSKCESCGSTFVIYKGLGEYKCESCGITFLDDYGKVRNYIEENGPSSAFDISQGTGVSRQRVNSLLHEGRVGVSDNSSIYGRSSKSTERNTDMHGRMRYIK